MYQPRAFREGDRARLHELVEQHSFGTLIAVAANGEPEIAHVPFVLDRDIGEHGQLRLHVAAANPIWRAALAAGHVTVVFEGPHGYVSASWYERPTEQVPTWNYAVVHARGVPARLDADGLVQLLDDLVATNEPATSESWSMARLDAKVRDDLLLQIVGLSVAIERLDGKFKLSQNRSEPDRLRVIEALRERGTPDDLALVAMMERPR